MIELALSETLTYQSKIYNQFSKILFLSGNRLAMLNRYQLTHISLALLVI